MLFNSSAYIFFFLPLTLLGFWGIARFFPHKVAAGWLALCSLFFYGWWDTRFISLLLASITFNYCMGVCIERARHAGHSGTVLAMAVASNLSLLGLFKYSDFFLSVTNSLAGTAFPLPHFILPLGISFFTFTQIAFLVDVHRGIAKEYSPVHYVLFVTYFPHLIAGPILHHKEMMPQFAATETYSPHARGVALGLFLFALGLFKKTVLADSIAPYATAVFSVADKGEAVTFIQAWEGALAYTLQLYFDFSGYVDMAIGASKMLGIDLPINFNSPYKAINISDFWRRWHMTLGRFFRDYVYIPLGGNRKGLHRAQLNIVMVMLLSGLWHGAGWTFIIWGGLHALMSVINNYWRVFRERWLGHDLEKPTVPGKLLAIAITFICVVFCWVFFRAETLSGAMIIVTAMLKPDVASLVSEWDKHTTAASMIAAMLGVIWLLPNSYEMSNSGRWFSWQPTIAWLVIALAFMTAGSMVMLYSGNVVSEFLYFNF